MVVTLLATLAAMLLAMVSGQSIRYCYACRWHGPFELYYCSDCRYRAYSQYGPCTGCSWSTRFLRYFCTDCRTPPGFTDDLGAPGGGGIPVLGGLPYGDGRGPPRGDFGGGTATGGGFAYVVGGDGRGPPRGDFGGGTATGGGFAYRGGGGRSPPRGDWGGGTTTGGMFRSSPRGDGRGPPRGDFGGGSRTGGGYGYSRRSGNRLRGSHKVAPGDEVETTP